MCISTLSRVYNFYFCVVNSLTLCILFCVEESSNVMIYTKYPKIAVLSYFVWDWMTLFRAYDTGNHVDPHKFYYIGYSVICIIFLYVLYYPSYIFSSDFKIIQFQITCSPCGLCIFFLNNLVICEFSSCEVRRMCP